MKGDNNKRPQAMVRSSTLVPIDANQLKLDVLILEICNLTFYSQDVWVIFQAQSQIFRLLFFFLPLIPGKHLQKVLGTRPQLTAVEFVWRMQRV